MINFPEEIVLLAKTWDVSVKHPARLEELMRFKNYHMFPDLWGKWWEVCTENKFEYYNEFIQRYKSSLQVPGLESRERKDSDK